MTKIAVQPVEKDGEEIGYITPTEVHQLNGISRKWYILSIIATILFCPLFGLMGFSHSLLAVHNGELGNVEMQRRWIKKTKIFTGLSFGFGTVFYLILIFVLIDYFCWYCFYGQDYYGDWCGTGDFYYYGNYTYPDFNSSDIIVN